MRHSRFEHLTEEEVDRVIGMAWEDRTPFEAIEFQFGLSEADVIELMRRELKPSSWRMSQKRFALQVQPTAIHQHEPHFQALRITVAIG